MSDPLTDEFRNEPIRGSDIPDYRKAELEPVAPTFRRYALLSTAVGWGPFLVVPVVLHFARDLPAPLVWGIAGGLVLLAILNGGYRWIDAGYRGWALRDHDLIARHGVLWRSVTTLPIARIQHVETTSGPLERANRLARLKLYTAGGMTADLTVLGLETETADRLREYLVEQIRLRDASTSGPADDGNAGAFPEAPDRDRDADD